MLDAVYTLDANGVPSLVNSGIIDRRRSNTVTTEFVTKTAASDGAGAGPNVYEKRSGGEIWDRPTGKPTYMYDKHNANDDSKDLPLPFERVGASGTGNVVTSGGSPVHQEVGAFVLFRGTTLLNSISEYSNFVRFINNSSTNQQKVQVNTGTASSPSWNDLATSGTTASVIQQFKYAPVIVDSSTGKRTVGTPVQIWTLSNGSWVNNLHTYLGTVNTAVNTKTGAVTA